MPNGNPDAAHAYHWARGLAYNVDRSVEHARILKGTFDSLDLLPVTAAHLVTVLRDAQDTLLSMMDAARTLANTDPADAEHSRGEFLTQGEPE